MNSSIIPEIEFVLANDDSTPASVAPVAPVGPVGPVGPVAPTDPDVEYVTIEGEGVTMDTISPEPEIPGQKYCCVTYAPHIDTRRIYISISGCYDTIEEATERARLLFEHDPRFNRYIMSVGNLTPIPIDWNLYIENPIIIGHIPEIAYNIVDEPVRGEAVSDSSSDSDSDGSSDSGGDSSSDGSSDSDSDSSGDNDSGSDNGDDSYDSALPGEKTMDAHDSNTHGYKCIACISKDRNALFLPCRHLTFCMDCVSTFTKKDDICPMCRTPIKEVYNVFL
jgi:hypothetical protein